MTTSEPLRGPDDRYTFALEATLEHPGRPPERRRATEGVRVGENGQDGPESYVVLMDESCSVVVTPGLSGLTLRSVKLLDAHRASVSAVVTAGGGAPEWLPTESAYALFDGDRKAAAQVRETYIPFEGLAEEPPSGGEREPQLTSLDQLAIAIGRSVARANATLARTRSDAGVALVSRITFRVGVEQTSMEKGRVQVVLGKPVQGEVGQYVELTMTTVPGAQPDDSGGQATASAVDRLPEPARQGGHSQPQAARVRTAVTQVPPSKDRPAP